MCRQIARQYHRCRLVELAFIIDLLYGEVGYVGVDMLSINEEKNWVIRILTVQEDKRM